MLILKGKDYRMGFYWLIFGMILGGLIPTWELDRTVKAATPYLTITDDLGRAVTLQKKPERLVIISTSLLNLYYAV